MINQQPIKRPSLIGKPPVKQTPDGVAPNANLQVLAMN
jgi:hypothetical protein